MADTANLLRETSGADLDQSLPVWLLNEDEQVCAGCLLVNISDGGGAVLMPVHQPIPLGIFDLVVLSPENSNVILTILQAEKRWIAMGHTETYNKVGMEFTNINPLKLQVINSLIKLIDPQETSGLLCSIISYNATGS